jgi:hypothetical protein
MNRAASVEFIPLALSVVRDARYFPVQALDKDLVAEGSEMMMDIRWQVIKPAGDDRRHRLLLVLAVEATLSACLGPRNSEL